MDNVRVHDNFLYQNRGSGIYFGTWGVNGPRSNIFIYNNTIFHNGSAKHWAGGTGGIDVRAPDFRQVSIVNNIVFDNGAYEIATFAAPDQRDAILKAQEIVIANNLTGTFHDASSEGGGLQPALRLPRRADDRGGSHVRGPRHRQLPAATRLACDRCGKEADPLHHQQGLGRTVGQPVISTVRSKSTRGRVRFVDSGHSGGAIVAVVGVRQDGQRGVPSEFIWHANVSGNPERTLNRPAHTGRASATQPILAETAAIGTPAIASRRAAPQ